LDDTPLKGIAAALGRIPSGLFIVTARHEERSSGMLASWVQQACFSPPMVSLALAKGRPIMPLISDSRRFALCQLQKDDRALLRKFAGGVEPTDNNPFLGMELAESRLGLPLPSSALAFFECELVCHMDVEGDHDLFVGRIVHGGLLPPTREPHVHLRENGLRY
jgi:flavin reductase (DIM6/NTAB) family NADH-FMN oxidoreductase RutF